MFEYLKNKKLTNYVILICLIVLVFGIQVYLFQKIGDKGDFIAHLDMAQKMLENDLIILNHPFYHLLVITFSTITGISLIAAGYYLVPLLSYVILGIIIYKALVEIRIKSENDSFSIDALIITLCLMLVGPISFFIFPNLYFGYIGISVYHSPTQILAKPLSLIIFLLLMKGLNRKTNSKNFKLCLALVTVFSLMAKPSYLICLVPALLLFSMLKLYKNESINLNLIFFFLAVNGLVLTWQYWLTYGANDSDHASKIIFAPFVVMHHFAYLLSPRLIASVLFPATVYLVFFDKARRDSSLNLAWLTFGISLFYTYFLAESGSRLYAGNFAWGSQASLFILFVFSTIFLIKEKNFRIDKEALFIKKNPKLFLCIFTFFLHLLSGLLYYFNILRGSGFE